MALVQHEKVIRLQQLIVELEKRQAGFQALLVDFEGQHAIDAEVATNIAQEINIAQIGQPIDVVEQPGTAVTFKTEIALQLRPDGVRILLNRLRRQQLAHF